MNELAPIVLFVYNRPLETKRAILSLSSNYLAKESELFVFSDAAKNPKARERVDEVREYLKTVDGFRKVHITESEKNKGLAKSVISGVSKVLENYEKVIVLEDDLVTSKNFLDFMNQALNFYSDNKNVISISGYTLDLPSLKETDKDYYVCLRASSWGWGMWSDKWNAIDWTLSDYRQFSGNLKERKEFAAISSDLPRMLRNQKNGKIDSWAIRLTFHQFRNRMISIFPTSSKLVSIGMSKDATHTVGVTKFDTKLDTSNRREFSFDDSPERNDKLLKDFKRFFSVRQRMWDKILRIIELLKR